MTSLTIEQKRVDIYPSAKPGSPIIYLNTFSNAVNSVYKNLMALGCPDFSLVAVSKLKWDHDMTPWYMRPISKHDTPCTGGADDYLKLLLDEIIPEAEAYLPGAPAWRGLSGYSLAGLFALYALYRTDVFARAAVYLWATLATMQRKTEPLSGSRTAAPCIAAVIWGISCRMAISHSCTARMIRS